MWSVLQVMLTRKIHTMVKALPNSNLPKSVRYKLLFTYNVKTWAWYWWFLGDFQNRPNVKIGSNLVTLSRSENWAKRWKDFWRFFWQGHSGHFDFDSGKHSLRPLRISIRWRGSSGLYRGREKLPRGSRLVRKIFLHLNSGFPASFWYFLTQLVRSFYFISSLDF